MVVVVEPSLREINLFLFKKAKNIPVFISVADIDSLLSEGELRKMIYAHGSTKKISAIAFKVYFGGDIFNKPQYVDDKFLEKFSSLGDFLPLYVLFVSRVFKLFKKEFPNIPVIAFFETSFFSQLPAGERYYALPHDFHLSSGLKKWGFHGIYHRMNGELAEEKKKVISVVLDKQTTVCSILDSKPYSISLGCTPLEGVMSRTCCGDVDAGMIFYLMKIENMSTQKLDNILKNESGFFGMTGYDLTLGEMLTLYGRDKKATLAFDVYQAQILKHMSEGMSILGGVDEVIFAGRNCNILAPIIFNLLKRVSFLGITIKNMPWNSKNKLETITYKNSSVQAKINYNSAIEAVFFQTLMMLKNKGS